MDLIGKNGMIDGVLAAQVLLDGGVFFFKPGELYYDGTYHQIKGMQANTAAMRDFPGIFDKMDTLAPQLVNLMVYVEKNTHFRVKYQDLGKEVHEFLQNEDMTGMTFLYLFKWHLLALNRSATGVTASMETRVRTGIPDAEEKVRELVEMLIAYDGTDPKTMRITVIEVDANGKEVPKAEPLPLTMSIPAPAPTSAPSSVDIDPLPPTADARTISVVGNVPQDLTAGPATVVPDPLPPSSGLAGGAPMLDPLQPSRGLAGGAPTLDPLQPSRGLAGGAPALDPLQPSGGLAGGAPALDPLQPSSGLAGGAPALDPLQPSGGLAGGAPALDPLPPSSSLVEDMPGGAPAQSPFVDPVAASGGAPAQSPFVDPVAASGGVPAQSPFVDPVAASGGAPAQSPFVDPVAASGAPAQSPFVDPVAASGAPAQSPFVDPVAASGAPAQSPFVGSVPPSGGAPDTVPISIASPTPNVAPAAPSPFAAGGILNAVPPVAPMPMPSAVPTAVPMAADAPSAPIPPELSAFLDEIKPKMQKIIEDWTQYSQDFEKKVAETEFNGFSDPKIKEYRDEIGDKQEDFGEQLEEILETLNDHIEKIDANGVAEDVMKSVLDQERECYSALLDLKVNLDTIGEVDYRITRRCSKNHEKWDKKYISLPSVQKAVEEEQVNQERQRIANEIAASNERLEQLNREYTDAKTTIEISQTRADSKADNQDQDRQKMINRAEAAVGAVEEKIRENDSRIEELEVENKRLEDELKDAKGFAFGRKRTLRDTLDYNMEYITKYRSVGENLLKEKARVQAEWDKKLEDLVGDSDHLETMIQETTAKMQALEQEITAEREKVQKLQEEYAKIQ